MKFNGSKNVHHYGTCSTGASTVDKGVTFATGMTETDFQVTDGVAITVRFTNANTANNPRLKVGSVAAPIYYRGININANFIKANSTYIFVYENGVFHLIGDLDTDTHHTTYLYATTSNGVSNSSTENGNTTLRLIENETARSTITIKGDEDIKVTSNANGTITIAGSNNKVTNTPEATTKAYVTGTTTNTANTGTQIFDPNIFIDTEAGKLVATTFKGSLDGTANKATQLATPIKIRIKDNDGNIGEEASFDGTTNIDLMIPAESSGSGFKEPTTLTITDNTETNSGESVSLVSGGQNLKLKLPSKIKADIVGNATSADKLKQSVNISISSGDNTGDSVAFNGEQNIVLPLPSILNVDIVGTANQATSATSAGKAFNDGAGNEITETYATKIDLSTYTPLPAYTIKTLIAESWVQDTTTSSEYKWKYNIIDSSMNVTDNDLIEIILHADTLEYALAAEVYPMLKAYAKNFVIRAKSHPTSNINISYSIYASTGTSGTIVESKSYMPKLSRTLISKAITKTNWVATTDTTIKNAGYNYQYALSVSGITDKDVVDIGVTSIQNPLTSVLFDYGFSPFTKTATNTVYLYAVDQPQTTISAGTLCYYVYKGDSKDDNDETGYVPKVYTRTTTIAAADWSANLTYTVSDASIKATDVVEINIDPSSKAIAEAAELQHAASSAAGSFTLTVKTRPTGAISITWRLYHGSSADASATTYSRNFMLKRQNRTNVSLPVSAWSADTTAGYGYKGTITNSVVTANDVVEAIIAVASKDIAAASGMCPVVETTDGSIIFRAYFKPTTAITLDYYIYNGN